MDSLFQFNAGYTLPAPSLTVNPTAIVQLIDPTIYQLSNFFAQLLNTNLMPRFAQEAQECGLTHENLDNFVDNVAVAQKTAFPLHRLTLQGNDFKFPMLNVMIEQEQPHQITLTNVGIKRDICVSWVLPPLTIRQYNRLYYFLSEVSKIWTGYGQQGFDPKVMPNGPSVWQTAGLSYGSLNNVKFGHFQGLNKDGKLSVDFPSIQYRLSFVERNQLPVAQNYQSFSHVTYQQSIYDGYNIANPINNFVDGYVYPNITLTSCSPNTGTIKGYTLVQINGTGFTAGKIQSLSQITVCGAQVASFLIQSETVIIIVTNPGITTGIGDIVLTDLDSNKYVLSNAFTYV
jgi:hypothetical protein